jgi:hypothetical protein
MRNSKTFKIWLILVAAIASLSSTALGASCPYCGKVYAEVPASQRAYYGIDAARAEHERTCPKRPGGGSSTSIGDDAAVQAAGQLGQAIHEMLFGNPQDQAREKEKAEREAQLARELEQARKVEEARQAQLRYDRLSSVLKLDPDGQAASKGLQLKLGDDAETDDGLRPSGNSFFGTGGGAGGTATVEPNTDPMVVDARNVPTGLPIDVENAIPKTPAGDRVRKGFQAIQAHDWKVALAWFQDALNHEPNNPGIKRLVDLAQYTLQRESQTHAARSAGQNAGEFNSALLDYNQNLSSKHPELKHPESMSDEEFFKQQDPAWMEFFRYITPKPKPPGVPTSVDQNAIRG